MATRKLPTTWAQVCKIKGIDPKQLPDVSWMPENMQAYMIACYKLPIIVEVLNDGWVPDWSNTEPKYYGWYVMGACSGSGFAFLASVYDHSFSAVGSRPVFKSRELVYHANEHFAGLYKDYMTIPQ